MMHLIHILSWFQKDADRLSGQMELTNITTEELRRIFKATDNDPMYDSFPVKPEHIKKLQRWVDHDIRPDLYDYFVECEEVKVGQPVVEA